MRYLAYLFPILINIMNGGMFFITAQRFAEAHASKMLITGTMVMWAFMYSVASLVVGRFVTEARSAKMICVASLMLMGTMIGAIVFPSLNMQFVWMAGLGISGALYCTAFQVFMKCLENGEANGVVRSTSLYTAAWSLGLGLGPFIFGVMDWRISYGINAVFALLISIGVMLIDRYCRSGQQTSVQQNEAQASAEGNVEPLYRGRPNMVMLGWIGGFLGTFTISILRTMEPARAVELGLNRFNSAMVLAVVSYVQALVGLMLIRGKLWMYNRMPLLLTGLCGVLGLLGIGYLQSLPLLYLSAVLYGTFSCAFYFRFVFLALVHPTKGGFYVSINEAMVGISSTVAPFCAGLMSKCLSISGIFTCCAVIVGLSTVVQMSMAKDQH